MAGLNQRLAGRRRATEALDEHPFVEVEERLRAAAARGESEIEQEDASALDEEALVVQEGASLRELRGDDHRRPRELLDP